jgi:hypothetical protein
MYPAQALADGEYSASDLPDAVTVDGTSFSRSNTGYGNTTHGVIFETSVWAKYRNGVRSERPCLIQGGVVDQFADTYTVNWNDDDDRSVVVTRTSVLTWEGPDPKFYPECLMDRPVLLSYVCYGNYFGWVVSYPYGGEESGCVIRSSEISSEYSGPRFQNTPVGYYDEAEFVS